MFEVRILNNGIKRPYADTKYEYEVTTDETNEEEVKRYCTEQVHRASKSEADDRGWSETYYEFRKIGENTYRYTVVIPNCD